MSLCLGEEVRKLKARMDAYDGSSQTSRSTINIVDPIDSSFGKRVSSVPSDNTVNLGPVPAPQDPEALQKTIQQILRSELQSDTVKGIYFTIQL